jgi:hypothetical protein
MSYNDLRTYTFSIETAQEDNTSTSNPEVAKAAGNGSPVKANNILKRKRNHEGVKNKPIKTVYIGALITSLCALFVEWADIPSLNATKGGKNNRKSRTK